jgi:hypothetical protein
LGPGGSRRALPWRPHVENERAAILVAVSPDDRQQVRPIWNGVREKHDDLSVGRADHRHQVGFTPDLRRLRSESDALNRQRLIHAIGSRAQNSELVRRRRNRLALFLRVGKLRPQQHE